MDKKEAKFLYHYNGRYYYDDNRNCDTNSELRELPKMLNADFLYYYNGMYYYDDGNCYTNSELQVKLEELREELDELELQLELEELLEEL